MSVDNTAVIAFEDELEILITIKKDLCAIRSVAGMAAAYPSWGGESDAVRVISRAVVPIARDIDSVIEELEKAGESIKAEEQQGND